MLSAEQKVKNWIQSKNLISVKEKVLCAVSGGKDSVAMVLLLKSLDIKVAIAHVNFNLRGTESQADEAFVKGLAKTLKVSFYGKSFDTKNEILNGESIQLAARRLRYNWFRDLSKELGFDKIATAHSANDNAETILYNLTKGTGLKGLMGIPPENNLVIRPIMCLSTHEILEYLESKNQTFRNDSSNESDKYARNKIRHHVIPSLQEINAALPQTLIEHSERFTRITEFYYRAIEQAKTEHWKFNKGGWYYTNISEPSDALTNELLEHLMPLGFSQNAILDVINGKPSAEAISAEYRLINNRHELILVKSESYEGANQYFEISEKGCLKTVMGNLTWEMSPEFNKQYLAQPNFAFIAIDHCEAPLKFNIRKVRQGDKMKPFGLKGKKLMSDLFTDQKLNAIEKEQSLVLELNGEIIWWVGKRISNDYKISSKTKKFVKFTWLPQTKTEFAW